MWEVFSVNGCGVLVYLAVIGIHLVPGPFEACMKAANAAEQVDECDGSRHGIIF